MFLFTFGGSPGFLIGLYSLILISAFLQGWLAAPLTYLLPFLVGGFSLEGLQSWLGGLASLVFCGRVCLFLFALFYGQF